MLCCNVASLLQMLVLIHPHPRQFLLDYQQLGNKHNVFRRYMLHSKKRRFDLSSHSFPHLHELIILFDFYTWQGPIHILEGPRSSEHPFTGRFLAFQFFASLGNWDELLLEDGDDSISLGGAALEDGDDSRSSSELL